MKKNKKPQMNALQQAQLADCARAGMNFPQVKPNYNEKKGFTDLPLFATTQQTKLF